MMTRASRARQLAGRDLADARSGAGDQADLPSHGLVAFRFAILHSQGFLSRGDGSGTRARRRLGAGRRSASRGDVPPRRPCRFMGDRGRFLERESRQADGDVLGASDRECCSDHSPRRTTTACPA